MGDYTKVIINASIKKITGPAFVAFEQELREKVSLCSSAYHCGGELLHLDNEWHHRTDLVIVTQRKYGNGIDELLEWLGPYIIRGSGKDNAWAFILDECTKSPTVKYLTEGEE